MSPQPAAGMEQTVYGVIAKQWGSSPRQWRSEQLKYMVGEKPGRYGCGGYISARPHSLGTGASMTRNKFV